MLEGKTKDFYIKLYVQYGMVEIPHPSILGGEISKTYRNIQISTEYTLTNLRLYFQYITWCGDKESFRFTENFVKEVVDNSL